MVSRPPRTDGTPAHHESCRFQLSLTPRAGDAFRPGTGRDTRAVLAEWLHLDTARIDQLETDGALT
ncbi:MAG: hypothetical protein R3D81_16565 [Thalassovita sp.]